MEEASQPSRATGNETTTNNDFNKSMLYVFDESEIKFRQKQQMFGNMRLIVELYKHQ